MAPCPKNCLLYSGSLCARSQDIGALMRQHNKATLLTLSWTEFDQGLDRRLSGNFMIATWDPMREGRWGINVRNKINEEKENALDGLWRIRPVAPKFTMVTLAFFVAASSSWFPGYHHLGSCTIQDGGAQKSQEDGYCWGHPMAPSGAIVHSLGTTWLD